MEFTGSVIDTQYDVIMWEEQQSETLASAARVPTFCSSHIMMSYCVFITEQITAKSYLFVKLRRPALPERDKWRNTETTK